MLYRGDINDPALANASETHCLFELLQTYNCHACNPQSLSFRLAKSILEDQTLPNDCLGRTPLEIVRNMMEN